jgi:hypothetical protein
MKVFTLDQVLKELKNKELARFFGEVSFTFQNGKIVTIKIGETKKPEGG